MIRRIFQSTCFVVALAVASPSAASTIITFESLSDGETLSNQFAGLAFSGGTTLVAGISLDEIELPPHSGTNVVLDAGGPISIDFSTPIGGFGGYFSYTAPVTVSAFDSSHTLLGSVASAFSNNLALSGEAGSSPNEFLQFVSLLGIRSVTITGDAFGGSFVLDDLTTDPLEQAPTPVPEPGTLSLLAIGLTGAVKRARTKVRATVATTRRVTPIVPPYQVALR